MFLNLAHRTLKKLQNIYTVQQDTQSVSMSEFYSALMLARHVSDLTGPSSGAFYKLYVQIWYAVIRVLLDTSSRYKVVGRTSSYNFVWFFLFIYKKIGVSYYCTLQTEGQKMDSLNCWRLILRMLLFWCGEFCKRLEACLCNSYILIQAALSARIKWVLCLLIVFSIV